MAYRLPTFNLVVHIWRGTAAPPLGPPDVITNGNLAWGRRVATPSTGGTSSVGIVLFTMTLLLPKLTDIRGDPAQVSSDTVEVPAGSGRYYFTLFVDDIGKGFLNEHRAAILIHEPGFLVPTP